MTHTITKIILIVLLLLASYSDLKTRKIPNKLNFPIILIGIAINTLIGGFTGLKFSVLGLLFGIAIFFIPFALNFMGAGDVKLMGAIGSLMGWRFTFNAVLYTAIVGGIIVIIMAIYEKRLPEMLRGVVGFIIKPISKILFDKTGSERFLKIYSYFNKDNQSEERKYIPYAIPITIGSLLMLFNLVPTVF